MAELKTRKNDNSVEEFLNQVEPDKKRRDSFEVLRLMKEVTGERPKMWGAGIVGFGSYHYKYKSGREGDWFLTGFSPRKQAISLYIMSGFSGYEQLLNKLGKYKTGKSCLYIKRLEDIDQQVLRKMIKTSVDSLKRQA